MKPNINVTPLIDILLVLLIIFMVISPIKSAQFETKIPSKNTDPTVNTNPLTLVVRIDSDSSLHLNNSSDLGTVDEPSKLSQTLAQTFAKRLENGVINENLNEKKDAQLIDRIQKTVFIKAPKSIPYGKVVRVIDEIKLAGANPISLQIDDLE